MKELITTILPIGDLKPAPYNPRRIQSQEMKKLKASIKKYGLVEPLVWNKQTGHVVGGNQRLVALKRLKYKEVRVTVVDLPLAQEKALNLALNRISGEWDTDALKLVIESIDDEDRVIAGFDEDEITGLLESISLAQHTGSTSDDESDQDSDETAPEGQEQAGSAIPPPPPRFKKSQFVLYLAFDTIEAANKYLLKHFRDKEGIEPGKKTKVMQMSE